MSTSTQQASKTATGMKPPRRCVFTALIGGYEQLNEQIIAGQSSLPFICLTDDPDLRSDTWQMRHAPPIFGMDPIRSQREIKLRPHVYLPDFDVSLYIDNSVLLTQLPERVFERYAPASGFCLPRHSYRNSTLDEFLEVARLGFDDQSRIFEQLNHYAMDCPEVLQERPYWAGIMLRDHRKPEVRAMLEIWAAHVQRYSRRDQLSVTAAFRQAGLTPDVMEIDNLASWFHSCPHTKGRDYGMGVRHPSRSFSPPVARIRQLEQALAELTRQNVEMKNRYLEILVSRSWRYTQPLRTVLHLLGVCGRALRRRAPR